MTESITCPRCERTSYNPNDVLNKYCGACFRFHPEKERATVGGRLELRAELLCLPVTRFARRLAENTGLVTIRGQCLCGDPKCDWSCPKGAAHPMDRT